MRQPSGEVVVRPYRNTHVGRPPDGRPNLYGHVSRRQALRRAARDKLSVVKYGAAAAGAGGDWTHAELWLVPPGAEPPAAISRK